MNITKIKIKNLFGITEYEMDGKSIEIEGKNGVGKTSVIDAIRYALTNKSERNYVVRNGESEGEILIETDDGLRINRKPRTAQADYKSIKKNGAEISSPESFLKDIFTELQLNPVEFMHMSQNDQNRIILDLIEFDWSMDWIKQQFGEIPQDVSYDQNILSVLNDIQSESGFYFRKRQDVNRDARNKLAFVEDIANTIPVGYDSKKWESENLSVLYTEIETIRKNNETIEKAKLIIDNRNNKVRSFEANREISIASLERETSSRSVQIDKDIESLKSQIKALEVEKTTLSDKKIDKLALIEEKYKSDVARYDAEIESYKGFAEKEVESITELSEKARLVEEMKGHLNEYKRMTDLQNELEILRAESADLTRKIEKARSLPGEILETATIPVENLTIKDGVPLIKGLPVSNLSEGEKLDLCIDVAIQKPNGLQIILIDGVEKLATDMRSALYEKCKAKGLQFISTRTTDSSELTVIEL